MPPLEADAVAELRAIAAQVAGEAASLVRELRAGTVSAVATKSSQTDVVTAADTAAEELIRRRLAELRPGEPVLGEEGGGAETTLPGRLGWVVDPIDGTVNYLYGYPWYAVSVAAVVDRRAVAGAVVEPSSGRVWSAAAGQGASCDGRPLWASATSRLDLALVATGFSYTAERRQRQAGLVARLLPRVRDVRRAGSAALDLCAVAAGWVDGYVEHGLSWWDWAAGGLIAAEAGAVVRPPALPGSVEPPDGLGRDAVFAAAPGVAAELAALCVELDAGEV
ncbi:MAG: inositol monophosphatase family protein [Pseudonocardia sp.]